MREILGAINPDTPSCLTRIRLFIVVTHSLDTIVCADSTGNSPEADYETLSNSEYMKRHRGVPKRVVAYEFNQHVTNYIEADFEEETLTNMRCILDFCMNDDWFLL